MFVTSSAIQNGAFEDKYGKRGTQFSPNGMPTYSIPFEIHDAPQGTQSFAVVLEESQIATDYVQGANTWASKLGQFDIEEASFYGGMAPPNCLHRYELIVYALDTKLNLKPGFRFNDLHFAMQGHILDQAVIMGTYDV